MIIVPRNENVLFVNTNQKYLFMIKCGVRCISNNWLKMYRITAINEDVGVEDEDENQVTKEAEVLIVQRTLGTHNHKLCLV